MPGGVWNETHGDDHIPLKDRARREDSQPIKLRGKVLGCLLPGRLHQEHGKLRGSFVGVIRDCSGRDFRPGGWRQQSHPLAL